MKASRITTYLFWGLQIAHVTDVANVAAVNCDVSHAYSILEALSTGTSFCSSLLYPTGPCTVTKHTVTTTTECTRTTITEVEHVTTTDYSYSTTTLPTITLTEYSSTILIAIGTTLAAINKRAAATTSPANQPANPTPTALTTCAPQIVSAACSSLMQPSTTTTTITYTSTKLCTITVDFTKTKTDRRTTVTLPFPVSPPPIIISTSATLTTTVPAACAGTPYLPGGNGVGDIIQPIAYPYFPQTQVECCLVCHEFQNCVASAFISSGLDCQLLLKVNSTGTATTAQCPLGIENYPFGSPHKKGNVYPGPCGH